MALAGSTQRKIFDGRYEVLSIVGRGSCSVVYQARHSNAPSSEVALKVLLDKKNKSSNTDRLRKEALALVSSRHRYVVRLDDFHSVGDLCYLSMEYAPESDLRRYTQKLGGKLPHQIAELFLTQAAEALDFVHHVGVIHRDIKPDNILVVSAQEIRLADFGVAVLPGEVQNLNELQAGVGTMNYMAPEVLEGSSCDVRSDIYALGVTFYEALCGIHPFEKAPLMKQLEAREDGKFPPLGMLVPKVPERLAAVIMRAMAYSPADRFGSAREMIQELLTSRNEAGESPVRKNISGSVVSEKSASEKVVQANPRRSRRRANKGRLIESAVGGAPAKPAATEPAAQSQAVEVAATGQAVQSARSPGEKAPQAAARSTQSTQVPLLEMLEKETVEKPAVIEQVKIEPPPSPIVSDPAGPVSGQLEAKLEAPPAPLVAEIEAKPGESPAARSEAAPAPKEVDAGRAEAAPDKSGSEAPKAGVSEAPLEKETVAENIAEQKSAKHPAPADEVRKEVVTTEAAVSVQVEARSQEAAGKVAAVQKAGNKAEERAPEGTVPAEEPIDLAEVEEEVEVKELLEDKQMAFGSDSDDKTGAPNKKVGEPVTAKSSKGGFSSSAMSNTIGGPGESSDSQAPGIDVKEEQRKLASAARGDVDPFMDPGARKPTVALDRQTVDKFLEQAKAQKTEPQEEAAPPREKIQAKSDEFKKPKKPSSKEFGRRKASKLPLLIVLVAVGVFVFRAQIVGKVKALHSPAARPEAVENPSGETATGEKPALAGTGFPVLPGGMFAGTITGFLPGKPLPLVMISQPEHKQMVMVIGIEGWTPTTVKLDAFMPGGDSASSHTVRVTSNGFVMDFTGQMNAGEVIGTFKNTITGDSGEWRVAPQQ